MKSFLSVLVCFQTAVSFQLPTGSEVTTLHCVFAGRITEVRDNKVGTSWHSYSCKQGDTISFAAELAFTKRYSTHYRAPDYFQSIRISQTMGLPMDFYKNRSFTYTDTAVNLFCESHYIIKPYSPDSILHWLYIELAQSVQIGMNGGDYVQKSQSFFLENEALYSPVLENENEYFSLIMQHGEESSLSVDSSRSFSITARVRLVSINPTSAKSVVVSGTNTRVVHPSISHDFNLLGKAVRPGINQTSYWVNASGRGLRFGKNTK